MAVNSNALAMLRELNTRKARESLWAYCVITSPEFYKAHRWHLWIYCEVLQALYERRLTKSFFLGLCRSPNVPKWYEKWYGEEVGFDRLKDNQNFTYLMTNMAPRMGKSRSLVKFCDWILGKSNKNKIISVSYNDDLAEDSSRYVRDGILERKNLPMDIVFADVFLDATIKADNKSLKKWALDGCFFSYMGAGLNGTITGKGGNCLAEGTLIDTTQGKVSIEFIAENYKYINIFVKTFDTHDLHVKYSKVVNASMTFSREECTDRKSVV